MASKKFLSNALKSVSKNTTMISLPHWFCSPTPIPFHPQNSTFGRKFYTSPSEEEEIDAKPPVDTSKMDINRQPLMGMHGFDFKRILFCSRNGFWHHKVILDSARGHFSPIINLDIGTSHVGVSLWHEGMNFIELLDTFYTKDMRSELNQLIRRFHPYGFVIGYPVGPDGGTTPDTFNQSHVNEFLFNLDSLFEFSGIPICLVNEFGTTKYNEREVNELIAMDKIAKRVGKGFISLDIQHRNALSAREQMIRFIRKVAPHLFPRFTLPPRYQ